MDAVLLFMTLAITVEGLIEYVKTVCTKDWKCSLVQAGALVVSIALCLLSGADIYAFLGVTFQVPFVGSVLTGIFASRGANYASDMLGKLRSGSETKQ